MGRMTSLVDDAVDGDCTNALVNKNSRSVIMKAGKDTLFLPEKTTGFANDYKHRLAKTTYNVFLIIIRLCCAKINTLPKLYHIVTLALFLLCNNLPA